MKFKRTYALGEGGEAYRPNFGGEREALSVENIRFGMKPLRLQQLNFVQPPGLLIPEDIRTLVNYGVAAAEVARKGNLDLQGFEGPSRILSN
jgi:hypothetical protein